MSAATDSSSDHMRPACLAQRHEGMPRICSKLRDHVGPHSWDEPTRLRDDRVLHEFVEMVESEVFCSTTSVAIQKTLAEVCRRLLP